MFDFYQKRKLRSFVNSPIVQSILGVFALWIGWSAYVRFEIAMEMSERRQVAEQKVYALQAQRDKLSEQVEYLTDERGIESEMRRQFDVALEGEQVVVIFEEKEDEIEVLPLSNTVNQQSSKKWYQFWR